MSDVWEWPRAVTVEYDSRQNKGHSARDGDTFRCDVDLGLDLEKRRLPIRLFGINAPELGQPGSLEARDHLRRLLPIGTMISLRSVGYDKYGPRVDAVVIRNLDAVNVNEAMLAAGHATRLPDY
jgi:endonuclease YncB( thermonuclease family)